MSNESDRNAASASSSQLLNGSHREHFQDAPARPHTSFFEHREVLERLQRDIIPELFAQKGPQEVVRLWSVNYSTGEEVYSLAILLAEEAERRENLPSFRIFATNLSTSSLDTARRELYPPEMVENVSPGRLKAFFDKEDNGYRIRKELRERVVFAWHDVSADPPFSHLDFISCWNLLAPLERDAQRKLIELFHYVLEPEGALLLDSPVIPDIGDLFRVEGENLHLFRKRVDSGRHLYRPRFAENWRRLSRGADTRTERGPAPMRRSTDEELQRRNGLSRSKASNAPMRRSTDEELQPLAEELEASNEELETTSEELHAVADENSSQIQELGKLASDLENLLAATESAILLLDCNLRVVRFTPKLASLFSVRATDCGRPISDLRSRILYNDLPGDTYAVLNNLRPTEREVQDEAGNWYLMRILPYCSIENPTSVDGVTITFIDITGQKSADEALRGSEERFRALVNASSEIVYQMSPDWTEMRQLIGKGLFSNTDRPNTHWLEQYIPADDRPKVLAAIEEAIRTKTLFELEHRVLRADGTLGWTLSRAVPVLDAAGNITEWFGAATDVTDRKYGEGISSRLSAIVQNSNDAILSKSLDGIITTWNLAAERMFGYTEAEALGKPIAIVVPPELLDQETQIFERLRGGERIDHFETRRITKDGSTLDVAVTISPLRDSSERIIGASSIVRDITERKQTEQALREREEDLRATFDLSAQAPWTADPDGNILDFSERWLSLTGKTREELSGQRWMRTFHPEDLPRVARAWEYALRTGEPYDVEHRIETASGEYCWMRTRAFPRLDGFGRIVKWYATMEDIHERKLAEERLDEVEAANREMELHRREIERANQLKNEFLASMSHELRTPLHTILGFAQLLEEQITGELNPKQQKFLGHIHTDAEHLLNLINGILDLSKIEAGRLELNYASVNLNACLSQSVTAMQARAAAKSIIIEDRTAITCQIPADPLRIKQILYNLLGNAIKFTSDGGHVWVEASLEDESVRVTVADSGMGIPPDEQEKIFDKFHQAGNAAAGVREGTGLGLTITKQLIELHGGRISVESTPGIGSQFSFTLPLSAHSSAAHSA